MFDTAIIEVAIGLTFVFLILSLCATALVEGLVESRQWRGRLLHVKLGKLLGTDLRDVFYQDRRIVDLASGEAKAPAPWKRWLAKWPWASRKLAGLHSPGFFASTSLHDAMAVARRLEARRLPSQIPDEAFAEVVLDWLRGVYLPQQLHPDFAIEKTLPYHLAALWNAMNLRADGSQNALRQELIVWYRQSMERTSGEFKRRIRLALYALGALLVLATNADTLYLADRFQDDPRLRAEYVALSKRIVEQCPQGVDGCPALEQITKDTLSNPAEASGSLLGWTQEGWDDLSWLSILGWLITILAIGLGADFWFGALKKILSLRGAAGAGTEPTAQKPESQPSTLAPRDGAPHLPLDLSAPQVAGLRGFQPLRYGESNVNAFWLAHFASLAYSEADQLINSQLLKAHGVNVAPFDQAGTQGFVFTTDEACIVAFRGTEQVLEDWLADADARHHVPPWSDAETGVGIHRGFQTALDLVWPEVITLVKQAQKPIWITGHSLGGALAMLTAARFARESPPIPVAGVYTFGQPRVGSRAWAETLPIALQQRVFRYVNNNDIVPLVPPSIPIDYHHVGSLRYFDGSGRLHHTRTVWERIAEQLNPVLGAIASGNDDWAERAKDHVRDQISDHGMARYIECFERLDAVRALWDARSAAKDRLPSMPALEHAAPLRRSS